MSKSQPPPIAKLSPRERILKLIGYGVGIVFLIAAGIVTVQNELSKNQHSQSPIESPLVTPVVVASSAWVVAPGNIEPGIDLYVRDHPADQPELWCTVQNPHIDEDGIVKMQVLYPSGNVGFIDREKTLFSPRSKAGGLLVRRSQLESLRAKG